MSGWLGSVEPCAEELSAARPGDDIVPSADVVMDRAFTVDAAPAQVWPWLQQLGKQRAGWYFPRWAERVIPRSRRAIGHIDARWQHLRIGDVVPDYGGRHATFTVAVLEPPTTLVYRSARGRMNVSWAITLRAGGSDAAPTTRIHLRLRLGPVKRIWLAERVGGLVDLLTIAGLAAGLRERLAEQSKPGVTDS